MSSRFIRAGRRAGFDMHVVLTLLLRGWSVIAGAVMVLLIPFWLGQEEQGYYYTFASLLGLQIFFELGMSQVILQFVGHEFAHIQRGDDGSLIGDDKRLKRLSSLLLLLHRWYVTAAVFFFMVVSIGGVLFFLSGGLKPVSWVGPWLMLTLATAINLYFSAKLAVLEGCGEIGQVAKMRLSQSILGYLSMWLAFSLGAGLWAVTLVPIAAALGTTWWLSKNMHPILYLTTNTKDARFCLSWKRDIFPFQWKISLSWVSGYFIFQIFTPLIFAKQGAVDAGRIGITLAVFNSVLSVGMSWVYAKVPAMSSHISRNERSELNELFLVNTRRSIVFTAMVSAGVVLMLTFLSEVFPEIAHRFASISVAVCIAIITVVNNFVFAAAAYMRAHKEEPMLWLSLATGLVTVLTSAKAASSGVLTMMVLYMLITTCLTLPWTIWLFAKYYKK